MSVDISPATWLGPGYSLDNVNHLIAFNTANALANVTLPQLLDVKANPSTGDIRQVEWAIVVAMYEAWLARGPTGQTTQMRQSLSIGGAQGGAVNYIFQQQFTVDPTGIFIFPPEP